MMLVILVASSASGSDAAATGPMQIDLKGAIEMALAANRTVLTSANNVANRALSMRSVESDFDLKFIPSAGAGFTDDTDSAGVGITVSKKAKIGADLAVSPRLNWDGDNYFNEAAVSLEVPLLRGFGREKTLDTLNASRFSFSTSKRVHYLIRVSIAVRTVSTVYDVVRQEALVVLYEDQVQKLQGHSETARVKEKIGMADPIDVYRAEIRLKDAQSNLSSALERMHNAVDSLKILVALPLERPVRVTAPLFWTPVEIGPENAVETALANRVELIQAKKEVVEADRRVRVAKHDLLPELDLVVDYQRRSLPDELDDSFDLGEESWQLSLQSQTDLTRSRERANYQQRLNQLASARLNLVSQKQNVIQDVRQELNSLRKTEERIRIRQAQIRQAEGKLELARVKFNHGIADNFDVIEAETELQQAQANLIGSTSDHIIGTYQMRAALGTLIER
ncbi:MAG: TolC family protein [Deltaproteobacteria bacterium]|nr:TolC family protein [Deltaproteobacteria bacterium]